MLSSSAIPPLAVIKEAGRPTVKYDLLPVHFRVVVSSDSLFTLLLAHWCLRRSAGVAHAAITILFRASKSCLLVHRVVVLAVCGVRDCSPAVIATVNNGIANVRTELRPIPTPLVINV